MLLGFEFDEVRFFTGTGPTPFVVIVILWRASGFDGELLSYTRLYGNETEYDDYLDVLLQDHYALDTDGRSITIDVLEQRARRGSTLEYATRHIIVARDDRHINIFHFRLATLDTTFTTDPNSPQFFYECGPDEHIDGSTFFFEQVPRPDLQPNTTLPSQSMWLVVGVSGPSGYYVQLIAVPEFAYYVYESGATLVEDPADRRNRMCDDWMQFYDPAKGECRRRNSIRVETGERVTEVR